MAEFIKNRPFRFWCQKVLPLVYDDSLSYYELLCKVVCKLNELAENQNNLSDEIKQVAQDLDDFKNQVPGMIEAKVQEWLDNYITTHGLVNSVNGMTGVVTLTAADVGAIAKVKESVKNNNIAGGAVTTGKIAVGIKYSRDGIDIAENLQSIGYLLFHTRKDKGQHLFRTINVRLVKSVDELPNDIYKNIEATEMYVLIEIDISEELESSNIHSSKKEYTPTTRYDAQYSLINELK